MTTTNHTGTDMNTHTDNTDIRVTVTVSVAEALCATADILYNDGSAAPLDIPVGTYVDTNDGRWTWALDEATQWAMVRLAEQA